MAEEFRFRLEVVRRLRRRELEHAQRTMAGCVRAVLEARQLGELLDRRIDENTADQREMRDAKCLDLVALRTGQVHVLWLRRMREQTEAEAVRRREIMEVQRQKLVAASRQVKVLDKLRERQVRRHLESRRRLEQRELDEVAISRTFRE